MDARERPFLPQVILQKLQRQLEQEQETRLYMQVLTDKVLQILKVVLVLQLQIKQERQKAVVSFHLDLAEEDKVTTTAEEYIFTTG